ncbi:MAG: TetR/AcrR family transcriptional regulator [Proteobacteria bacterium]|nr:TetR/AcrR family transcriptional regulator [Pseudomonadota bacterium]
MFHPETENRQVARSRGWIWEALLRLMEKKNFSEITITEICGTAGVGRQTFYRRFAGKEDIIKYELDRSFERFLTNLFDLHGSSPTPKEITVEGFNHWRKNERVHRLLIKHNMDSIILKSLEQHFLFFKENHMIQSDWGPYLPEFALGGVFMVLLTWTKSGMRESSEEMGRIVSGFFNPRHLWE